jgi:hypothetical protein
MRICEAEAVYIKFRDEQYMVLKHKIKTFKAWLSNRKAHLSTRDGLTIDTLCGMRYMLIHIIPTSIKSIDLVNSGTDFLVRISTFTASTFTGWTRFYKDSQPKECLVIFRHLRVGDDICDVCLEQIGITTKSHRGCAAKFLPLLRFRE